MERCFWIDSLNEQLHCVAWAVLHQSREIASQVSRCESDRYITAIDSDRERVNRILGFATKIQSVARMELRNGFRSFWFVQMESHSVNKKEIKVLALIGRTRTGEHLDGIRLLDPLATLQQQQWLWRISWVKIVPSKKVFVFRSGFRQQPVDQHRKQCVGVINFVKVLHPIECLKTIQRSCAICVAETVGRISRTGVDRIDTTNRSPTRAGLFGMPSDKEGLSGLHLSAFGRFSCVLGPTKAGFCLGILWSRSRSVMRHANRIAIPAAGHYQT